MIRRQLLRFSFTGFFLLIVAGIGVAPVVAATYTWQGATTSMSVGTNWVGGMAPAATSSNQTLIFGPGPYASTVTQDIANPLEVQSLQVNEFFIFQGTQQYRMKNLGAAPSIAVNHGSLQNNFQNPIEFADPTTIQTLGGSFYNLIFSGVLSGSGGVTFDGQAAGGTTVYLQGPGNTLTGNDVVTGSMVVNASTGGAAFGGTVAVNGNQAAIVAQASNQFAAGTDVSLVNGGSLHTNVTNQTVDQLLVESAGFVSLTASDVLTVTGPIMSSAGVGSIGFGNVNPSVDFAGQFKTVNVTSTGAGDVLRIRDKVINGSINKTGPGRLEVTNGANAFTGTNVVNGGTLIGSPLSVGTVANNSTVEFNAFGTLAAGQISGPGQVVIRSVGVTYGGAQAYSGGTVLDGGFASGEAATLLGTFTATTGGNLTFVQNTNAAWTGTLSGPASLSVNGGTGVLSLGGTNSHTGGTFVGSGAGLDIQSNSAIGSGPLSNFGGSLSATGVRTISNQLTLFQSSFDGGGDFDFTDTATKFGVGDTTHNSTGTTKIAGIWQNGGGTITVNAGNLQIGNPAVVNGFTSSGSTIVNGGTLTLRSLNFITLPSVTLAGGTLNVPNGYAVPLGAVLQGNGAVTGRVATANGSTIIATANMIIGDAAHVAGVNLDGELYTGDNAVTLNDANQAVLGSLTNLGFAVPGTLNAPNGLVVNFGRNITGWGTVNSTNSPAQAVIMNGDVQGDSVTNYIDFTGYVKGVGTFNNIAFSGTFSPGLSPALVEVGNALLTSTNTLEMEIGGANRGGQYDAIDVSGTLKLGGTLKLSLLNSFAPAAGNEWQLFDGALAGGFSDFDLPWLGAGLSWDLSRLYSDGVAAVVAGLTGDFDADGDVDGGDLLAWQRGQSTTPGSAGDFINWRANFAASLAAAAAVPEPGTCSLVVTTAVAGVASRRRRNRA